MVKIDHQAEDLLDALPPNVEKFAGNNAQKPC
jgi:hypothetical protein